MTRPRVSVVVPVYRNETELRELHARLAEALDGCGPWEVVFVDDASPDSSAEVLSGLAAEDPRVRVHALARNAGQHRAVLAGMRVARGERVVVMDADLQDPPEAVPALLDALDAGQGSIIFAARRGAYEAAGRLRTSRAFKHSLARVTHTPPDAGMFFALDTAAVDALLAFRTHRPFVPAMLGLLGLPIASVPVERAARATGESAYSGPHRLLVGLSALSAAVFWRLRSRGERARVDALGAPLPAAPARRLRATLLAATGVSALATLQVLTSPTSFGDEGWFVQACARVLAGERLYADVFFPATPLSLMLASTVMRVTGAEVVVPKVLAALLFTGTALCVAGVARSAKLGAPATAVLVAALLVFSPPLGSGPFYNALASFLLAACLVATLLWLDAWQESPGAAGATAGVLIALTIAAKQNVGALALIAFLVCAGWTWASRRGTREADALPRSLAFASGGGAAVLVVVLAPIVASGSFPAFLGWTVGTRGAYVRTASIAYASGLLQVQRLSAAAEPLAEAAGLALLVLYALPLFALAMPAAAFIRRRDGRSLALFAFAAAGLASAFPRWDVKHLMLAAPVMLAAVSASWPALRGALPRMPASAAAVSATAVVMVAFALGLAANVQRLATGWYGGVDMPHFAGAIAREGIALDTRTAARTLKEASAEGPVFLLGNRAGTLYLGSGTRNPTPDDCPAGHTTEELQRSIVAAIESGRIAGVWWDRWQDGDPEALMPVLARYVETSMTPDVRTTQGTLHRRKP